MYYVLSTGFGPRQTNLPCRFPNADPKAGKDDGALP
jgi:hypothetical protein